MTNLGDFCHRAGQDLDTKGLSAASVDHNLTIPFRQPGVAVALTSICSIHGLTQHGPFHLQRRVGTDVDPKQLPLALLHCRAVPVGGDECLCSVLIDRN